MFSSTSIVRNVIGATGAILIGAACLTVAVAPAAAAPTVTMSKAVSFADLNLANQQGRDTLTARIKSAARSVCSGGGNDLTSRLDEIRCTRNAVAAARF